MEEPEDVLSVTTPAVLIIVSPPPRVCDMESLGMITESGPPKWAWECGFVAFVDKHELSPQETLGSAPSTR